jgi:prevent-host-death family protein
MATVTIHKAKTHLSQLIEQVERGEEVIIARGKTPVVRLVPYAAEQPSRGFGSMKGQGVVGR